MTRRCWAALAALVAASLVAIGRAAEPPQSIAARVVIVGNRDDPDSLAIARHYADVRGVPPDNIFALPMPGDETISWGQFVSAIWQPVQDELVRRQWIDALAMSTTDAIGRRKYAVSGHRIAALIVCRGVPLRIEHDPALYVASRRQPRLSELRTNQGAVDSELSLLAADGGYPINGFVPNPLYNKSRPTEFDRAKVVKVARLDGPAAADALALVDRAVAAERQGLIGRAYIDKGGEYPEGNRWLADAAERIKELGFDLATIDRERDTMPPSERCDAPAIYFGWHTPDINGPFSLPGFRLPPGAIAFHIHSYSAHTLRSSAEAWCGPLVARGAAATLGNVFEPFLQATHRPDLLFRALAAGDDLVDAAYYAMPVLSWQGVVIGDPLYRPFAVTLSDELLRLDRLPAGLAGYVVLRKARLLEAAGERERAVELMKSELRRRQNLALALALAERLRTSGQSGAGAQAVISALPSVDFAADQWGLIQNAAEFMVQAGQAVRAVEIYRRLLGHPEVPREPRARWLVDARQAAIRAGDSAQAAAWKRDLDDTVAAMLKEK